MGHAVAVGDVNGDGWDELFVAGFADRPVENSQYRGATGLSPDRLLLGGPSGFNLDQPFPEMYGRTSGASFADLDGDGDLDLVIARNYRSKLRGDAGTVVLRNDAVMFTQAATLITDFGGRHVAILDYDGDGLLDLFISEDRCELRLRRSRLMQRAQMRTSSRRRRSPFPMVFNTRTSCSTSLSVG